MLMLNFRVNKYTSNISIFVCVDFQVEGDSSYGGLEGPEAEYIKLISNDGYEFVIKQKYAMTSGTIKAMLTGPGQFSENETNQINFQEIP